MVLQDKTIETTFGKIKVFGNVNSAPKSDVESEKRIRKARYRSNRSREQEKLLEEEQEEEEIELKSIEEAISADTDKIVLNEPQTIQHDTIQVNHLDIFGLETTFRKNTETEEKSAEKIVNHVSVLKKTQTKEVEVKEEKEFASDDAESFGSLRKTAKNHSMKYDKSDEQIVPIIKARNLCQEYEMRPAQKIQSAKKDMSEESALRKDSYHKELRREVPDWFKMTKEETVEILKKNICYINEESKRPDFFIHLLI